MVQHQHAQVGAPTRARSASMRTRFLFERGERYACPGISSESRGVPLRLPARLDLAVRRRRELRLRAVRDGALRPRERRHAASRPAPTSAGRSRRTCGWPRRSIPTSARWRATSWSSISRRSRPCSPTSGRSSPRTRASSICARRPTASSSTRAASAPRRTIFSAGSSDIDVALKLTGTADSLVYGAFRGPGETTTSDDVGRLFAATRVALPLEHARVGYLGTWTDHPFLDRDALVNAVDYEVTPNDWWRVSGQVIRSDIGTPGSTSQAFGVQRSPPDTAATRRGCRRTSTAPRRSRHTLKLLYIDDQFDLNDLGYMERNSLRQVEWETQPPGRRRPRGPRQRRDASVCTPTIARTRRASACSRALQLSRDVQYASNWSAYEELRYLTSGVDDLISRGNGPVQLDDRAAAPTSTPPRRASATGS